MPGLDMLQFLLASMGEQGPLGPRGPFMGRQNNFLFEEEEEEEEEGLGLGDMLSKILSGVGSGITQATRRPTTNRSQQFLQGSSITPQFQQILQQLLSRRRR